MIATSFVAEISFAGRDPFWVGPIHAADRMAARIEFHRTFRETFPELPTITRIEPGTLAVFIHRPGQELLASHPLTLSQETNDAA
jgi:hypothetical protein